MQFSFVRTIAGPSRPVIPFSFAKLPRTDVLGLVDSGANRVRVSDEFTTDLGVDLSGAPETTFFIGGQPYVERTVPVSLRIGKTGYTWKANVSFVTEWGYSFQILGMQGFFDQFTVRIDSRKELVALTPQPRR
jgi:hypothetical protein